MRFMFPPGFVLRLMHPGSRAAAMAGLLRVPGRYRLSQPVALCWYCNSVFEDRRSFAVSLSLLRGAYLLPPADIRVFALILELSAPGAAQMLSILIPIQWQL
jgi:hypothetical protein